MPLRRDQQSLLLAGTASVALWAVPALRWLALPLVYLNTHVHELCHALTAVGTGGTVEKILVFADGSGVTPVFGGSLPLTASAGYVGAALVGAIVLAGSRREAGARAMVWTLCACLIASVALFVRGDAVGLCTGWFWALALGLVAVRAKGTGLVFLGQFLGLQLALTSLQALLVLLRVTVSPEPRSDALLLQQASGVPAVVWAVGWSGLGLVLVAMALSAAWKPSKRP